MKSMLSSWHQFSVRVVRLVSEEIGTKLEIGLLPKLSSERFVRPTSGDVSATWLPYARS